MQRNTAQRQAIQRVIREADRPLGPEEICESAKTHCPGIGIATVYRAVREMVESGELTVVNLPGDAARYEIAGQGHHHFFFCRNCKKTFNIDGCPGNLKKIIPADFTLEEHEIILYGLCDVCGKTTCGSSQTVK
jgi:Fur family ferric uptake transcriptional regulator